MSTPVVATTKSIERVRTCEALTKLRTVGSVSQCQLPLIEIHHNKHFLTVNLENCLPDSWSAPMPEVNDSVMIWGEVDRSTDELAFDGDTITFNALIYKICNGLNITKWSNAVDQRN